MKPYFRFGEDGRVSGHGGCNSFGGGYTLNGRKVTFSQMFSTRMACPGEIMTVEHNFLQALEKAERFRRDGTRLVLIGAEREKLAEFIERH